MKIIIALIIGAVILLIGCGGQPVTTNASLGQEFSLVPNQSASVIGEPLKIRFLEVVSDSRCPTGVQCIWAGEASCTVEITYQDSPVQKVLTQSGSSNAVTYFNDYEISFEIQPYPKAGERIEKKEYRLQLNINSDEIQPAPIHEVQISIAKSNPPQIIVYIKGGLSDGCTTFNELKTSLNDNTLSISVTTRHPKNKVCPAIYGYFEQTVNLGSDFVRGQTYIIKVNDYVTTFQYPI